MTKNNNENNITYGISTLTPSNSVNISQNDITYIQSTPIWSNGVLNKIENLLNDSANILEQTNINDISVNSSIFNDVVDDSRVGAEQVLSVPIKICTLYDVVDKVLPFAPYVYKNYSVPLMTDDESTYCPTYSQINRSTELTVMLYQDKTYRYGRIFRFDGDSMSMPQLTMKKSGAKMNYANKNLVDIDDVDVVRKSYRIIVKTHNFSYKNDDNLKNGISMFINGCTLRTDLISNSEGSGIYVFETNLAAMPFEDMYLQCRYSYNNVDLFNEDIDMFYINNITDGGMVYTKDNFSYTISNKEMAERELFLFIGATVNNHYKSFEKIQIGKLLKSSDGNQPQDSQTIEDDVYIDIYARIKDRAIVGIGTDGYVNITDATYQSNGDMIIESPAYSIVYHTLYQNNAKLNLQIKSSDLAHRPYISYKFKNARTQQVIKDIKKINLSENENNIFSLNESVDPTDKYYLWVNTIETSVKKTIKLIFNGPYFDSQNASSVLSVTFYNKDGSATSAQGIVSYEYITTDEDNQLGCEVVFTINKKYVNSDIDNELFKDIQKGVILGWFYFNNQNISSPNMSFTYDVSTEAYTASQLFPLIVGGAEYKIYFTKQVEIKLLLQRNVKELQILDENGNNVFDDITPFSKEITLNNKFFKYTITYNNPDEFYNYLSYTIVRYPNDNPELKTTVNAYKDLPTTKDYNLSMSNLIDEHTYMINAELSRGYQKKTLTLKIDNSKVDTPFGISAVGVRLETVGITYTNVSTSGSIVTATYKIESGTAIQIVFNLGNDISSYESVTASGSCIDNFTSPPTVTALTFNATLNRQSYVFDTVLTNDSNAVDITLTPTKKTLYGFIIAQTNKRNVLLGGSAQSKICNVVNVYYYNEDESKYNLILSDNTDEEKYKPYYTLNTNYGVDHIKLKLVSQDRTVYPSFKYELYVVNASSKKDILEYLDDWTAYEENGNEIEFTNLKGKYPDFSNFRIDITSKYVGVPIIFGLQGLDEYTMKIYDKTTPSNSLIIGTESGEYDEEYASIFYKKYITTDGFRNEILLSFQYDNKANGYNYILYGNAEVNATYSSSGWIELHSEDYISLDPLNITSLTQTSATKSYMILFTPVHIKMRNIMFIGCGEDPDNFDNIIPASMDTYWYAKVISEYRLTSQDIVLIDYADEGYEDQNIDWSMYIEYDSNIIYSVISGGGCENLIKFKNLKNYSDVVWSTINSPIGDSHIYTNQSVEDNTDEKTLHMVRFNDAYDGTSCMLQGNIGVVLKLSVDVSNLTWSYGESNEEAQRIVYFGIFEYKKNSTSDWPAQEEHEIIANDINDITFTSSVWDINDLNLNFTKLSSAVNGRWYELIIEPSEDITSSTNSNSVLYIHYLDYKIGINMSHAVAKIVSYKFIYHNKAKVSDINTSDLMIIGDKYIWVEDGNDISGVSQDIGEGSNVNTAFDTAFGTGLTINDIYSVNTNYYTPGGSEGIFTTSAPRAYTYNGSYLIGKSMEYEKRYYLWFRRVTQTPNTWQKSQFYIDFKDWSYFHLYKISLTFIIHEKANVIPTTSPTLT